MSWWRRFIQWLMDLLGWEHPHRPKPVSNVTVEVENDE